VKVQRDEKLLTFCLAIGRALLTTALALLAFEAGSEYLYWLETGKAFLSADRTTAAKVVGTSEITTRVHPYFGFMYGYARSFLERNGQVVPNIGLPQLGRYVSKFSGCCDLPMRAEDHQDKFIVAVMGNSIAAGLGQLWQASRPLQERLRDLPGARGKQVLILNFAHGGYHPPQYLMMLAYFLSSGTKLDLVLYFATVNDTVGNLANEESGVVGEYPTSSTWLPLAKSLEQVGDTGFYSLLQLGLLRAQQAMQSEHDQCQLAACVMLLRPMLKIADSVVHALNASRAGGQEDPPHFVTYRIVPAKSADPSRYFAGAVNAWQRSIMLMSAIAKKSETRFATVLVPSTWSHPSQGDPPDSPPEQRAYYRLRATPLHGMMERRLPALSAAGVQAMDASHALDRFAVTDRKIYLDGLGHFGPIGAQTVLDLAITQLLGTTAP
jgi:hypothetical protein